jgi:hypothetical protein
MLVHVAGKTFQPGLIFDKKFRTLEKVKMVKSVPLNNLSGIKIGKKVV